MQVIPIPKNKDIIGAKVSAVGESLEIGANLVVGEIENQAHSGKTAPYYVFIFWDWYKMNFYLSAIDDLIKQPSDNPSIGMILCKTKKKVTVDYAFRDINKPIGVSEYEVKILESLPDNLKGSLPTIEQIENEFEDEMQDD